MAANALMQLLLLYALTGTNSGGKFTVGVSNEESNRNTALSFEPSCVRREGLSVDQMPRYEGFEIRDA